jgi:glycosyltransferase involved in cell wall biosynthesis
MTLNAAPRILIVIPVYNHARTLRQVAQGALRQHPHVLVVDDGSTDLPSAGQTGMPVDMKSEPEDSHPLAGLPVRCVRHGSNRGKGVAILTGAEHARSLGMSHIITLDADAQHDPADIPRFVGAIQALPLAVFVGKRDFDAVVVPKASRFGRAFSNFWYRVQTGHELGDTQSGFRAYPLAVLQRLRFTESRYSFEVEVLVRAAWAGFKVADVLVGVRYPARRVSHFHPLMDNVRLSILNTRLTIRAMMPIPQKRFSQDEAGGITVLRPLRSLRILLSRDETPKNLALAGALGMALGTLPLIGFHSVAIILLVGYLKLNKLAGLAVSQLCMPPFVPALCIETGHYVRHGRFLTELSWQTLGHEGPQRLGEWVLGSLALAPLLGLLCGLLIYAMAQLVRHGLAQGREPL